MSSYRGFSQEEVNVIWAKWKLGCSLSDIGRCIRKSPGSIFHLVSAYGGIAPVRRKRRQISLSVEEREEISRGIAANQTIRQIAYKLKRSPSTISREIKRNGGQPKYRAHQADERYWKTAARPKLSKLSINTQLKDIIAEKLSMKWSPEQISGWLRNNYSLGSNMHISHETIYKSIFIQSKGIFKKSLRKHLRSKNTMRRAKNARSQNNIRGQIIDPITIRDRPTEIEDRAVPGHWEGDLICGSKNSHMATLVERKSRFTLLVKVTGKDTFSVVEALKKELLKLPLHLRVSLTWDRGMELANHKKLSIDTNINVYFCDPRSPWQRGTNENTNRLLRQYFPKKTDLSVYEQNYLDEVARELNQRPRKILNFNSPADTLQQLLQ